MKQRIWTILQNHPSLLISVGGLLIAGGTLLLAWDDAIGYLLLVAGMGVLLLNVLAVQSNADEQ